MAAPTEALPPRVAVAHDDNENRGVRFNTDLNQMISPPAAAAASANNTMSTQSFLEGGSSSGQHSANPFASSTTTLVNPEDVGWQPGHIHPDPEQITERLQNTGLHQRRMTLFDYQPIESTPVSRVPSYENSPRVLSRSHTGEREDSSRSISSGIATPGTTGRHPKGHKVTSAMANLPLTPAASHDAPPRSVQDATTNLKREHNLPHDPSVVTPQTSPPRQSTQLSDELASKRDSSSASSLNAPHPRHGVFSLEDGSGTPSRESSPPSGTTTPSFPPSRPFTPSGEKDDPYARSKRPPLSKSVNEIEARFKFDPRAIINSHKHDNHKQEKNKKDEHKRHSTFHIGGKHLEEDHKKDNSMSDLKRFFRGGASKRSQSPKKPLSRESSHHGSRNSIGSVSGASMPFADDNGLTKKYGKFGKVLGSGAGGSVRLLKRGTDNTTFAVKEFRAKHPYESEREYSKKVTAEFCIGSTLHHGNIVETLDIIHERGKWYEVMEYCPYDLFATVMTGKMSREEVACCFMQVLNGVGYLHSMGLAHRDLKLDNVVINEHGILKIIDFGSAAVFRYPFETDIVMAHGIVGSDPYLAPEVCSDAKYDPQAADIWSLAIIFCCMSLRRFPWKAPRQSDNSFKLFAAPPSAEAHRDMESMSAAAKARQQSVPNDGSKPVAAAEEDATDLAKHKSDSSATTVPVTPINSKCQPPSAQPQIIRGPWRLLRLLPRESRHIIGKMLELKPGPRAGLEDIFSDEWVKTAAVCRQEEPQHAPGGRLIGGTVIRAPGHTHTLEKSAGNDPQAASKQGADAKST